MISLARLVLDRADVGLVPTREDMNAIPAGQWGVYQRELASLCPDRANLGTPRRRANALNVEVGQPHPRCLMRSPDGRGMAWIWSGGSVLAYGLCEGCACPRTGQGSS